MRTKKTIAELIDLCRPAWGNPEELFDYNQVVYKNILCPVKIICRRHQCEFFTDFRTHIKGAISCSKCATERTAALFVVKARECYGSRYDYSFIEYVHVRSNITIYCNEHQIVFTDTPLNHLAAAKRKSDICRCQRQNKEHSVCRENFLRKSKAAHLDRYDYSLVEYKTNRDPVKIICSQHGVFEQEANNHVHGHGCPSCGNDKRKETRKETLKKKAMMKITNEYI